MIKCEVVFDNNRIIINGFEVDYDFENSVYDVVKVDGGFIDSFGCQEEAIDYCLSRNWTQESI